MPTGSNTSPAYKRRSGAYASIATLIDQAPPSDGSTGYGTEGAGQIVINFPCMPESLEMARQATYLSTRAMPMPDGFHTYQYTEPLKIPLRFSLSARDDDYCGQDGPYTLLAIAARLHALVMPIQNASTQNQTSTAQASAPIQSSAEPQINNYAITVGTSGASITSGGDGQANVFFPPACVLAIVMASGLTNGSRPLGINCRGFVERVNVTFRGPWLQGAFADSSTLRNLPSFADYEFTFVHQPGYTNNYQALSAGYVFPTTSSADIFNRFYKEGPSPTSSNVSYANLNGAVVSNGGLNLTSTGNGLNLNPVFNGTGIAPLPAFNAATPFFPSSF